ncbi:Bacteriophage head to tail connecting protein [Enhydrobacter aerosaccus]|uniref:Bacteriophage head to tail connecting protein n=1 Tax=Enhydrobacter aerosaccus TaxID=225324 RepID=A0A1T4RNU1_9HYPH|nr:portal protein [Enhydrobacter aerosaccus]SKA17670.1 Bacteriophage head to tail connecting protein [Enhydrobacter aerosaccus]
MSLRDEYTPGRAAERYKHMERDRWPFLQQGRYNAAITIPWVCPPYTYRTPHVNLPKPNQGLAFRGLDNLVGTFLGVLLPPGMPFFKVSLQPSVEAELIAAQGDQLGSVVSALSKYEMSFVEAIEEDGDRAGISSGFLHLPITGNVLLHLLPKGGVRSFGLNQYVVRRGPTGKMLESVLVEATRVSSLDRDHQLQVCGTNDDLAFSDEIIDVYTHVFWDADDNRYYEYQEAKGQILEGTEGNYPEDAVPWLPLRWSYVSGEDYGRGLIEGIYKDVERFDHLSKAIGDASKNAAKLIWMLGGGGSQALANKLSKAQSGDFVVGDAASVKALQQEKAVDLQVAIKEKEALGAMLSKIFLDGTSIQRGGDRVTKFEVEYMARMLQAAYANEYTIIGREFQLPYFNAKTAQLRRRGVIPQLQKSAIKIAITTGIDALGRGSDQQSLETLAEAASKISQVPEDMIIHREYLRRSAANLGVKPDGLIPSDEQVQANQQQRMQAQMVQGATPEIAKGLVGGALQRQGAAIEQAQQQGQSPEPAPPQ